MVRKECASGKPWSAIGPRTVDDQEADVVLRTTDTPSGRTSITSGTGSQLSHVNCVIPTGQDGMGNNGACVIRGDWFVVPRPPLRLVHQPGVMTSDTPGQIDLSSWFGTGGQRSAFLLYCGDPGQSRLNGRSAFLMRRSREQSCPGEPVPFEPVSCPGVRWPPMRRRRCRHRSAVPRAARARGR